MFRKLKGPVVGIALTAGLLIVLAAAADLRIVRFAPIAAQEAGSSAPLRLSSASTDVSPQARQFIDQFSAAFEQAAAKVNPSVVPIFSEETVTVQSSFGNPNDPLRQFFGDQFYQHYFGQAPGEQQRTVHALGSGVIASSDGYILTNNHVVQGAQKLTVVLPSGDRVSAQVIGADPQTDLALVKVDAEGLPAATLGDSDSVKVGEWVIAVGNPFQLLHTTTAGIISAEGRSSVGLADYEDFIQTDAAINPGNSGGALADLDGNVIGINAAISSPSGGSVGLGFAIPINMAKSVAEQLKAHGRVVRGYLGVVLQTLTPELAKALGIAETTKGVLVGDVAQGGPAAAAGFQRGDVITEFNGQPATDLVRLRSMVANLSPGTRVDAAVLRDGRETTLHVTLGEQPQQRAASANAQGGPPSPEQLGLAVQTLTPDIAQQLGYQGEAGAVVAQVEPGSVAESAGLRKGDLIEEVNRQPVRSAEDLVNRLRQAKSGDTVALLVRRGKDTFFVALQIP
jgi:serine protease Do